MNKYLAPFFISLALLLSSSALAAPEEYQGIVNHIYDGATIRIAYKGGQIRVRLVDLPSTYAANGREALASRLLGKKVSVKAVRWQKGYLLGRVFADGRCVCGEPAETGKTEAVENDTAVLSLREEA